MRHPLVSAVAPVLLTGLCLAAWLGAGALAQTQTSDTAAPAPTLSLLKSVEIDLSGYLEAKSLPSQFVAANDVVSAIDASRNIALHMELIRRAAQQLSPEERIALLAALEARHKEIPDDVFRFFDSGYGEVLLDGNKTGLFFLRKANDQLKNQFTSLAYAMAQAEIELNQEHGAPDQLTPRKQDVAYKLTDAVNRDAEAHMPGFWPAFRAVIDRLRPIAAYTDYAQTDFTQNYLPYGVLPSPIDPAQDGEDAEASPSGIAGEASNLDPEPACVYPALSAPLDFSRLFRSLTLPLDGHGQTMTAHFFLADVEHRYRAVILDEAGRPLVDFQTTAAPYIFEDLDEDGAPEIVIRQMAQNPAAPLTVYRYNKCVFQADEAISALFR
ncbi:MAG: hypothetical protein IPK79_02585 [Vampirovibrionales bacterium]|nr:hypothetical protein [Vampirovibrionales bacterium]